MRHHALLLVASLAWLSCAPTPAQLASPSPAPTPLAPPEPPLPSFAVVDLAGNEVRLPTPKSSKTAVELRAIMPSSRVLWSVPCKSIQSFGADGSGGVLVVGTCREKSEILGIDDQGDLSWSMPASAVRSTVGGPISDDGTMAVALFGQDLAVWRISAQGRKLGTLKVESSWHREEIMTASGLVVVVDDDGTCLLRDAFGRLAWRGSTMAPAGDTSVWWKHRPRMLDLADGSLWLRTADQRIVAHDPNGRLAWSLGLRSSPSEAWRLRNGDVLVGTTACALIRVEPNGGVRWSTGVSADDSPACSWEPTFVAEDGSGALFVRAETGDGPDELRVLSTDGALRWKTPLPWLSYAAYFEPAGPDRVVVVEQLNERHTFVKPAGQPGADLRREVRIGQFTQILDQPIDSGIALTEHEAYALSGERLWRWDGSSWTGGRKLRVSLGAARLDELRLAGFKPARLVRGVDDQAWLTGWRPTEGPTVMRPYVPTLLRRKGGVWREDTSVARAFFEDARNNIGEPESLRVAANSTTAVVCGGRFCRALAGGRWAPDLLDLLDLEKASVGVSGASIWALHDKGLSPLSPPAKPSKVHPGLGHFASSALWGTGDGTLWSVGTELGRFDGRGWKRIASLVGHTTGIWGPAADDVWLTGKLGAAHWDGTRWRRVVGIHGPVRGVFGAGKHVWLAAEDGLWRFEGWSGPPAPSRPIAAPPVTEHRDVPIHRVAACADGYRVDSRSFAIKDAPALSGATEVVVAADGTPWFRDGSRIVELRGGAAQALAQPISTVGHERMAPLSAGRGWLLVPSGVVAVDGANRSHQSPRLPDLQAIATSRGGTLWAVGAGEDDGLPKAFTIDGSTISYRHAVPPAAYVAVSTWGSDEVWLAGGRHGTKNGRATWPAGEGIVVHGSPSGHSWIRIPAGPVLSVAAIGPAEAWAVGPAGLVARIRNGTAHSERLRPSKWLRGIAATGPDDIWMVGDDGMLVHHDGKAMCRIKRLPLPRRPQLVSVAARGPRRAWVVSPDGILDVQAP